MSAPTSRPSRTRGSSKVETKAAESKVSRPPRAKPAPAPQALVPLGLRISTRALRSANVEHDLGAGGLDRYVMTGRSFEMLQRVMATLEDAEATRAWSITGPYGSGKSSFALLLAALLCALPARRANDRKSERFAESEAAREAAAAVVRGAAPDLADRFASYQEQTGGMLRALATARREPVAATVARALANAAVGRWGTRPPAVVSSALLELKASETPAPAVVIGAVRTLASQAPLLLVLDEFGKNLEYFAAHGESADAAEDLFLLQELAELASGTRAEPIMLLTFQHASFVDYAGRSAALQRREWAKVQGRFVDVAFVDTPSDVAALAAGTIDRSQLDKDGIASILNYGTTAAVEWASRGYQSVLPADAQLLADTYPLHPLTVATLPALCATLGQHDRTLASFISADEPHTVERFLSEAADQETRGATKRSSTAERLSTVRLPQVFDYFATAVRGPMLASAGASRWLEIEDRLGAAHGLPDEDLNLLKIVAVLNLVDSSGALRASAANVAFATHDPQVPSSRQLSLASKKHLDSLVDRGFLTYRERADEYRLWAGSDTDIRAHIQAARDRFADSDVAALLAQQYAPSAVVAGKHSQMTGLLRHFTTVVTDTSSENIVDSLDGNADGLLVLHLGPIERAPRVTASVPVLIGITPDVESVTDYAREVLALHELLMLPEIDAVARREVAERLVAARTDLTAAFSRAYAPDRADVNWYLYPPSLESSKAAGKRKRLAGFRSLSALVSNACDVAYPHSPHIRNEMLGRNQLTSQGAKARRELITALIQNPGAEAGGILGNGPERAMYDGVLKYLELHGWIDDASGDELGFRTPHPGTNGHKAFTTLLGALMTANDEVTVESLFERLAAPPYGVKSGVLPLMLLSALVQTSQDVAIFDDGTFVPQITTDLFERLVKTPDRFTIRHIPATGEQRGIVVEELSAALNVSHAHVTRGRRNASLLQITSALLDSMRGATVFAKETKTVSPKAQSVRAVLQFAKDPDRMLFSDLPEALGFDSVEPNSPPNAAIAKAYSRSLAEVVSELRAIPDELQRVVTGEILTAFRLSDSMTEARADLAAQARHITSAVVEPSIAGLLTYFANETMPDDDWVGHIALIISGDPLPLWRDASLDLFRRRVREVSKTFSRLYALHYDATHSSSAEAFEARRITLTRPDGGEEHLLLSIPSQLEGDAGVLVESVLDQAGRQLGPQGDRILLAVLAKRLLEPQPDDMGKLTAVGAPIEPEVDESKPVARTRRKKTS